AAIVCGLVQAAVGSRRWEGIGKTVLLSVLGPLTGLATGLFIAVVVAWLCRNRSPRRVDAIFRRGQLLSAAFYSLGHGGNDAQKTMGIIFVLLIAASDGGRAFATPSEGPPESGLACNAPMGLGAVLGRWGCVQTKRERVTAR